MSKKHMVKNASGDDKVLVQTDEMKIKHKEKIRIDEELLYPRQLNEQLLKQIGALTTENDNLRQTIRERENEILNQNKNISSLNENIKNMVSSCGPGVSTKSAGIISSKITDLCKQNRHLVAELESHKTKCSVLERRLTVQNELEQNKIDMDLKDAEEKKLPPDPNELKEWKNKFTATRKKLIETRNKNIDLKNEIAIANKCLQNEIGDTNFSLQKLVSDPIGYKGRSQEIIILKGKISDLEEKLNIRRNSNQLEGQKKEIVNQVLKDIEVKKRSQLEKTTKELEDLKVDSAEVKRKLEGTTARLRVLNCEGVNMRQKIQTLMEKTSNDDKLVVELHRQQKVMENQYKELLKESSKINDDTRASRDSMVEDYENEKFRVKALKDKLDEKTRRVEQLNEQISTVINNSLQKIYFTPLQIAADNEIKILAELLNSINKRLDEERTNYGILEKKYFKLKGSKKMIEKKISQMDLEIQELKISKHSSLKTKSVASINSYKYFSVSGTQASFKTLTSLEESADSVDQLELESNRNRLEVAEEQIKCLESRLKISEDERDTDIECIESMIIQSKKIFADALKAIQESK